MNSKSKLALALVLGAAVGAAAVQGLHAQAKPKAYLMTEVEIIDAAAFREFARAVETSQAAAGGRNLRTGGGKVVGFVGEAPKNMAITEFESLDNVLAWRNSAAFKDLDPLRTKAVKVIRQFTVEARN